VTQGDTVACELSERITTEGVEHTIDVAAFYTVRGGRLARDATHGQLVTPVGRDGDVEHLVAQLQQLDDVHPERRVGRQHQDAVRLLRQAQLRAGADHPVGGSAVRLSSGDREAAGKHGARKGEGHPVPGGEVRRAADDLVDPAATIAGHVDVAVADRLLELRQLLDVEHLAGDDTAHVVAVAVQLLDLEAGAHEGSGDLVGRGGEAGHQLAQPRHGDAHVTPPVPGRA